MSNRFISFDTETTGLDYKTGDRVVEIGAVEILGRDKTGKEYQTYLNPDGKEMSEGAAEITNITNEQLKQAPKFKEVADEFIEFVKGAELIIHNAEFDVGFILLPKLVSTEVSVLILPLLTSIIVYKSLKGFISSSKLTILY